jgi:hypothetical protein
MTRWSVTLPILTVVAVAAIGCGEKSNDDGSAAGPPSRAEFVKQANAICISARTGLARKIRAYEQLGAGQDAEERVDASHFVYLPAIETQLRKVEELTMDLGIPSGDAGRINKILDAEKDGIDAVAVKPKVRSIAIAERSFKEADRLFRAYGLDSCANGA